jgi:hypothetical protein
MENERYDQLRQILALQMLPALKELKRRQTVIQATLWIGLVVTVIIVGLTGVLTHVGN